MFSTAEPWHHAGRVAATHRAVRDVADSTRAAHCLAAAEYGFAAAATKCTSYS